MCQTIIHSQYICQCRPLLGGYDLVLKSIWSLDVNERLSLFYGDLWKMSTDSILLILSFLYSIYLPFFLYVHAPCAFQRNQRYYQLFDHALGIHNYMSHRWRNKAFGHFRQIIFIGPTDQCHTSLISTIFFKQISIQGSSNTQHKKAWVKQNHWICARTSNTSVWLKHFHLVTPE